MVPWDVRFFSGTTAYKVRRDWNELIRRFEDPGMATVELFKRWSIGDPEDGPVVLVALAVCQWQRGCLQPEIKAKALEVIRTGAGLEYQDDHPGQRDAAWRLYQLIGEVLSSPPPAGGGLHLGEKASPEPPISRQHGNA